MSAKRLDPELWEKIKKKYMSLTTYGGPGWNARKSQAAVREYKQKGGKYAPPSQGGIPASKTHMHKWTVEKWGYSAKTKDRRPDTDSRYLPEKVRAQLTPEEIRTEKERKKGKKGKHIPYSKSVTKKMRASKIW